MQAPWLNSILNAGNKVVSGLMQSNSEKLQPQQIPLPEIIEQARREWQDAQAYYNTVTEEDLIDHAVYRIQAAEKRYMYLMKKARQEGVVYSRYMS